MPDEPILHERRPRRVSTHAVRCIQWSVLRAECACVLAVGWRPWWRRRGGRRAGVVKVHGAVVVPVDALRERPVRGQGAQARIHGDWVRLRGEDVVARQERIGIVKEQVEVLERLRQVKRLHLGPVAGPLPVPSPPFARPRIDVGRGVDRSAVHATNMRHPHRVIELAGLDVEHRRIATFDAAATVHPAQQCPAPHPHLRA